MSTDIAASAKVTVVGAGLMGTGIAHAFCMAGFQTTLFDINTDALNKAHGNICQIIADGQRLGKVTPEAAEAGRAALHISADLTAAAEGAALLLETASEQLAIKHQILRDAVPHLAQNALIGTNTSALSITEIAAVLDQPQQLIGMHFFNPVHKMKLVELIRGLETSAETIARAQAVITALGKTYITVNESPGFTTSRMSALMGNEAMYMLAEGVASAEDIDTAMRMAFNHPMGPLELGDLTGWDTRLTVLRYLHRVLGEKFRPCPLIEKMVAAGRYGRKVGRGVYLYQDGQRLAGSGLGGQ